MKSPILKVLGCALFVVCCTSQESNDTIQEDGGTGLGDEEVYPDAFIADICPSDGGLVLEAPSEPGAGIAFPIIVRTADRKALDKTVRLYLAGQEIALLKLYRGRGSATVIVDEVGPGILEARTDGLSGCKMFKTTERPNRHLSGEISGDDLVWSAERDVIISSDSYVPADASLVVQAGTRILLTPETNIEVRGRMRVQGTVAQPVLFAPLEKAPWGGIRFLPGARAEIRHALFTAGGADTAYQFGHSQSQPVLYAESAELTVDGGGLVDNPGKALGSRDASVRLNDIVISRCDSGGEHESSEVLLEQSHILEIPDGDGIIEDDDNDGIYLVGVRVVNEETKVSRLRDNVFAVGEDDAVDHNGAVVELDNNYIEGFLREGVAASNQNRITVRDTVIRRCGQGIEAGYGIPEVRVENCSLVENGVGLRFGDSYDWEVDGVMTVYNTVVANSTERNVWNYALHLQGPKPGGIDISCSMVDSPDFDGINNNLSGVADWNEDGCVIPAEPVFGDECRESYLGPRGCR